MDQMTVTAMQTVVIQLAILPVPVEWASLVMEKTVTVHIVSALLLRYIHTCTYMYVYMFMYIRT